jgi:hypothetical protein
MEFIAENQGEQRKSKTSINFWVYPFLLIAKQIRGPAVTLIPVFIIHPPQASLISRANKRIQGGRIACVWLG